MPNQKPLVVAISLLCLATSLPVLAQVSDPTQTRSTTRVVSPPPPPPPRQVDTPRPTPPPAMPTSLGQRDQPAPIQTPAQRQPKRDDDEGARRIGAEKAKVYDRNGRELSGMEQAGPDRVRDTRTGKYYNTVPMGDGQRIKP
jgi:hypothetical protein